MCANWRGSKLTLTAQTLIWCLSMGKQHMLSHITTHFIFPHDFFAIVFVYYNTIPHKSMPFGRVGDLLKILWWKVGFTPRTIGHVAATCSFQAQVNSRSTATSGFYYQKLQSGANVLNSHSLAQSAPSSELFSSENGTWKLPRKMFLGKCSSENDPLNLYSAIF